MAELGDNPFRSPNPFRPASPFMGFNEVNPYSMPNPDNALNTLDIDKMLKDLDEKFKELDKQEQESKNQINNLNIESGKNVLFDIEDLNLPKTKDSVLNKETLEKSNDNDIIKNVNAKNDKPKINIDYDSKIIDDNIISDDEFFDDFFGDDD